MPGHEEEAAIQSDAYIDALLARPRLMLTDAQPTEDPRLGRAANLLGSLPRYHPSFAFEEALAVRLRELAEGTGGTGGRLAEVIPFPGSTRPLAAIPLIDRRLLVGGAIASGVSVAALVAWWQSARRPRSQVVA
ncbi:MAG TPA: hypothetical protein VM305_10815 [Candidatus Limnocylindrales bacterium]|nr:hypothetical protein [Candidatus Limnocylindrales bacterium]